LEAPYVPFLKRRPVSRLHVPEGGLFYLFPAIFGKLKLKGSTICFFDHAALPYGQILDGSLLLSELVKCLFHLARYCFYILE